VAYQNTGSNHTHLAWLKNPAHKPGLCAEYSRCLRGSEQSHWNSLFIGWVLLFSFQDRSSRVSGWITYSSSDL